MAAYVGSSATGVRAQSEKRTIGFLQRCFFFEVIGFLKFWRVAFIDVEEDSLIVLIFERFLNRNPSSCALEPPCSFGAPPASFLFNFY